MTTIPIASSLNDLVDELQNHVTAQKTLALAETGLLDPETIALVQSFLAGYRLDISDVSIERTGTQVLVGGHSALPFASALAVEVALGLAGEQISLALRLWSEPAGGPAIDLARCLGSLLPGADVPLGGLAVSAFHVAIGSAPHSCEARITLAGDWTIDLGATAVALQQLTLAIRRAGGQTTGAITGTSALAGVPLVVAAELDAEQHWQFTAEAGGDAPIALTSAVSALLPGGASLPPELPDVQLNGVKLVLTPATKAFTFTAQSAAVWDLPIGIPGLAATADLSVQRAPDSAESGEVVAGPLSCTIAVGAPGPFPVIDGLELAELSLSFAHDPNRTWALEGGLSAALFEREFALRAALEDTPEARTITLSGARVGDGPLLRFSDNGALDASAMSIVVTRPKVAAGERPAAASWQLAAAGGITIGEIFDSAGTIEVEHAPEHDSFVFRSDTAQARIDVPIPGSTPAPAVGLALSKIAIVRASAVAAGARASWAFSIAASASFSDWPSLVQKILPESIEATLHVDGARAELTISRLARPIETPVAIAGQSFGTAAFDAANFSLRLGHAAGDLANSANIGLSCDLGVALPSRLNEIFGANGDGPAVEIFRTYTPGDAGSFTWLKLSLTPEGLSAAPQSWPISEKFIAFSKDPDTGEIWCDLDIGDYGAVRFMPPVFSYAGSSFAAKGSFEIVRDLALPLAPLRLLLRACKLDALAAQLPAALPLKSISLHDVLNTIGETIPKAAEAIDAIEAAIDKLPELLQSYLKVELPKQLAFAIELRPDGGVRLDIETDHDHPIRMLVPQFNPLNPMLVGVELRRLSFGELFGGTLFQLRLDSRLDMFDLLPLGAALALDELGIGADLRPDTHTIGRSLIIDDLRMALIYETGIPIPVMLFFNELALEHLGADGTAIQSHWSFPEPTFGLDQIRALLKQFGAFFSDADARLQPDNALDEILKLTIGANYLRLPQYLGGQLLGETGTVAQISGYELVAGLLNGIKDAGTGALIEQIPLDVRNNAVAAALGPLSMQGQWLITTPHELSTKGEQIRATPIGEAAELLGLLPDDRRKDSRGLLVLLKGQSQLAGAAIDGSFALAATNARFRTYLHASGQLGDVIGVDLRGSVEAPAGEQAFFLSGSSALRIFEHPIVTGDLSIGDQEFKISGQLDLLPGTPLRVAGTLAGQIGKHDFGLSGAGSIALGDWLTIAQAQARVDSTGVLLTGSWLGMAARLSAGTGGGQTFRAELDVAEGFHLGISAAGGGAWSGETIAVNARLQGAWIRDLAVASANQIKQQADQAASSLGGLRDDLAAKQQALARIDGQIAERRQVLQSAFDQGQARLAAAQNEVAAAQRRVSDYDAQIEARRRLVQQRLDEAQRTIAGPQRDVTNAQKEVDRLQGQINWYNWRIGELSGSDWDRFRNGAEITKLGLELVGVMIAKKTADGVLLAAAKALQLARQGVDLTPVDADLELIRLRTQRGVEATGLQGSIQALSLLQQTIKLVPPEADLELQALIQSRGLAQSGMEAAQRLLGAAQDALGVLGSVPGYIARAGLSGLVAIESASFSGALTILSGSKLTLQVSARLMGGAPQQLAVSFDFKSPLASAPQIAEQLTMSLRQLP